MNFEIIPKIRSLMKIKQDLIIFGAGGFYVIQILQKKNYLRGFKFQKRSPKTKKKNIFQFL